MKKLDLGQSLQVLGNLGVLVGILLLVFELNQNRDMMRAQTRHELAMGIVDIQLTSASNPLILEAVSKQEPRFESMEMWQIASDLRFNALFRYWENVHYQFRNGLYDELEYAKQKAAFGGWVSGTPAMVAWWCRARTSYSPEFAGEMDEIVGADRCSGATGVSE